LTTEKNWYAVYTKPRWEKKVYQRLVEKNLISYCPLNKIKRKWSDRIKVVEEPLFKSYVFVHISEAEKAEVRMTSGIVNFVYWQGKPALIKEEEIALIKRFLKDYEYVHAEPLPIEQEQKVRVKQGVLMNAEGTVVRVLNNKVEVILESLGYKLIATLDKTNLEPV
jgi:transcription antitermination factor NusG